MNIFDRDFAVVTEAGRNRLYDRIAELERALKPFAQAVFDDNGDVTVDTGSPNHGDWAQARRVWLKSKT